jgi:trans-aconitate 2-methyltransferase
MATVWDPAQYLRYESERLRPALDLLARIPLPAPAEIVDLGCGAGNVTAILAERYPQAQVSGVDNSEAMLAKAALSAPGCRFEAADLAVWQPHVAPDLIYSNAALHWIANHAALFPRLLAALRPGGVLAVQMPAMHAMPLRALQDKVAAQGPWAERLHEVPSARPILEPTTYWDVLRPHCTALEMWETTYLHALRGENAIVEWASGTSLRPYLDRLDPAAQTAFKTAYAEALAPHYPPRGDGTTLLPFRRLFIIATV